MPLAMMRPLKRGRSMSEPARASAKLRLALLAVILAACGLVATTWHEFGHTWDEPEHIAAGMALLDRGHYDFDIQHPPLARLLLALGPYLAGARSQGKQPPDGRPEGLAILYGSGHYDLYLSAARAGTLPFLALLLVCTWLWGRRCVGSQGALLAVLFVATTPAVLGHAGLATLDVAAAATCLLALYALWLWLASGSWRNVVLLGLAAGLAIGTKLSAIPFVAVGGVGLVAARLLATRPGQSPFGGATGARRAAGVLLALTIVAVILTLAYGGRIIYLTDQTHRYNQALGYLFGYAGRVHDLAYSVAAHVPVPEAFQWLIGGIEAITVHNDNGHLSYLLGETRTTGWWYFYIVALLAKTPLPLLAFGLPGLALQAHTGWRERRAALLAPALMFLGLLVFASLYSHINIGVRHLLVLYPLLAIGASHAVLTAWRYLHSDARARRWPGPGLAALAAALAWQAAGIVAAYPDYLAYFNEAVRTPEHVLVDSDLDWGQDLRRLSRRLKELEVPRLSLAYLGTALLDREGLPPYELLPPDRPATGWIAVSALARIYGRGGYAWLDAYAPRERVGKSIDLYFIASPAR